MRTPILPIDERRKPFAIKDIRGGFLDPAPLIQLFHDLNRTNLPEIRNEIITNFYNEAETLLKA